MTDVLVSLLLWVAILAAVPVLLVVVVVKIRRRRLERSQRDDDAAAVAGRLGWALDRDGQTHELLGWDYPFVGGDRKTSARTLRGEHRGRRVVAFDYTFVWSDDHGVHHVMEPERLTVAGTSFGPGPSLPRLLVVPEGSVRRLLGRATGTDVELESEDFNRAFTVVCDDRRFAFDLLTPRVMQLMLTWPDLAWRVHDRDLLAIRHGWGEVADVVTQLDLAADIMDLVPGFARDREGEPS